VNDQLLYTPFFENCLALVVTLPWLSGVVGFVLPENRSSSARVLAVGLMGLSVAAAFFIFIACWNNAPYTHQWNWFSIASHQFSVGVYLDNLSAMMVLVVTLISFLVHVYSIGYMASDDQQGRYFAMLGFFTFSMLGIVLADNLLLIFIFWELVGFCSYALIGHWFEKEAAAAAAKKAFLFNRIGDLGFLVGLLLLWANTSTFDIDQLRNLKEVFSWQTAASLCIFCGVIGKSAQFPLLTWLPDAMEGPTPVSALIHAATMVAAGVFLLARVDFLFTDQTLDVVIVTGAITALLAALAALVQNDLKKILAYSTISQLGLMVTAFGSHASEVAVLHLFTHAFFKACLFLSAGLIIHAMHEAHHEASVHNDVQDIRNLGGLRKRLPFTFVACVVSGAALAGIPFTSGFLSKDAILTSVTLWKGDDFSWRWLVLMSTFIVSFITVLYTFRLIWFVFMGKEKNTAAMSVHEPPFIMRLPVALLGVCSTWLIIAWNSLDYAGWLFNSFHTGENSHLTWMPFFSGGWVLLALATAYFLFRKGNPYQSALLLNNFYLDRAYQTIVGKPVLYLTRITTYLDRTVIDGAIHLAAYGQVALAHGLQWIDRFVLDGVVNGAASAARGVGSLTRSLQGGKIQVYILSAVMAILMFILWTLI